jgi:hypothetical protein
MLQVLHLFYYITRHPYWTDFRCEFLTRYRLSQLEFLKRRNSSRMEIAYQPQRLVHLTTANTSNQKHMSLENEWVISSSRENYFPSLPTAMFHSAKTICSFTSFSSSTNVDQKNTGPAKDGSILTPNILYSVLWTVLYEVLLLPPRPLSTIVLNHKSSCTKDACKINSYEGLYRCLQVG